MNTRTKLVAALALFSTLATGCKKPPPPTETPDAAAPAVTVTIASGPADGGGIASGIPTAPLKDYFPQDGAGGFKRVIRANRAGHAEASLEKDGKEVAVLSITDAERLAYARAKFDNATEKLQGFPLLVTGKELSTVLVRDRFEIKVLSKTLDADARKAILATFDLKGLGT
jgi:hypothetical protein